jgi:hypothetical protein
MIAVAKKAPTKRARGRRKGFPILLTKQRWILLKLATVYRRSKGKLPPAQEAAAALLPEFKPGSSGVRTIRVPAINVSGMRKLLLEAANYYYQAYGKAIYDSKDGAALRDAAAKLSENADPLTLLGDVVRHDDED